MDFPYAVIADNEIVAFAHNHDEAQLLAKRHSMGRYDTAKVIYMPNRTLQGHWFKGERIQ